MELTQSPPVLYARVAGIVLSVLGVLGMFVTTSQATVATLLGMEVNLTHNLLLLTVGIVGLLVGFTMLAWARGYAIVVGIAFTVLGAWGLVVGTGFDPFGAFGSINAAGSILHLAIGLFGIAAFAAARLGGQVRT
jgi:hypothetical protein